MAKDAEQLHRIMANLKCTEEEAAEIMAYDKAVDKGEKTPHDLTPAQNKVAQSYARTGTRKPTVYKFDKKERKPNEPKRELIEMFAAALTTQSRTRNGKSTSPSTELNTESSSARPASKAGRNSFSRRRVRGPAGPARAEFLLYHATSILSSGNLHKLAPTIFPDFVHFDYCFLPVGMLYYTCQGERMKSPKGPR